VGWRYHLRGGREAVAPPTGTSLRRIIKYLQALALFL
jgi:hypothetical protein